MATWLSVTPDRSVQVCSVGPDEGDVVLYFHSPATAGEELDGAAAAAAELGVRIVCVNRASIDHPEGHGFVEAVTDVVEVVAEMLELENFAVLGWSGGAPYALAASARLGPEIASVHLVSPVPGPLTGADSVPGQTERLRQVAGTTAASSWVTGPTALRDYRAVSAPWTFDIASITRAVTLWSPSDDEIVPPDLVTYLHDRLPNANTISVHGGHDWLTHNWAAVLSHV